MRLRTLASVTCAALLVATNATADTSSTTIDQGYQLAEIQHPRALAMADALQAYGGSTNALYYNPANLPLYRVYHLEAIAAFSPEARRQSYGGAIVDSSTSRLAGGFGGTWSTMDPDGIHRNWTDLRLALAYPFGERLSVGITGRYLRVNQAVGTGPLGASLASGGTSGDPLFSQFTFDAGLAVQLADTLRLAVSGRNLTAPGVSLAPTVLAGGLGYSNGTITVEADSQIDFTTYGSPRGRGMLGGEFLIADRFPVRAGYSYDAGMHVHALGAGAGYVDRRFSVELGVRRDIVADHPSTMLGVGLRLFIDSNGTGSPDQQGDSF